MESKEWRSGRGGRKGKEKVGGGSSRGRRRWGRRRWGEGEKRGRRGEGGGGGEEGDEKVGEEGRGGGRGVRREENVGEGRRGGGGRGGVKEEKGRREGGEEEDNEEAIKNVTFQFAKGKAAPSKNNPSNGPTMPPRNEYTTYR